jgi:hypothetical protein
MVNPRKKSGEKRRSLTGEGSTGFAAIHHIRDFEFIFLDEERRGGIFIGDGFHPAVGFKLY